LIGNPTSDSLIIKSQNFGNQQFRVSEINNDPVDCGLDDSDEDGVCDSWENNSSKLTIDYPTSTMNYNFTCNSPPCSGVDKRDIYIEIDYMQGHRPNEDALQAIIKAFDDAPFTGNDEIRVHIQIDDDDTVNIPHSTQTHWPGYNKPFFWFPDKRGFDQIKANYFGTPSERERPDWFDSDGTPGPGWHQKQQAFHYVLFVHDNKDNPGSSGSAEVFGDDIMISLGTFDGQIGSPSQQSGTLMHELGHNLNLHHGGAWNNEENCKPNYLSIMSYSKQFPDLDPDRPLDFSEYGENDLTHLIENGQLDEITGIAPPVSDWKAIYGSNTSRYPPLNPPSIGNDIDWNQQSPLESGVTEDVNWIVDRGEHITDTFDDVEVCEQSGYDILKSYDDWEHIELNSKGNGNWASGKIKDSNSFGIGLLPIQFENESINVEPQITFVQLKSEKIDKDTEMINNYLRNELEIFKQELSPQTQYSKLDEKAQNEINDKLNKILYLLDSTCIPTNLAKNLPVNISQQLRICIDSSDEITIKQVSAMRVIRIFALEDQIMKFLSDENVKYDGEYQKHLNFYKNELKSIRLDVRDGKMWDAVQGLEMIRKTYDGKGEDDKIKEPKHQEELLKGTDNILHSYSYAAVPEFGMFATFIFITSIILILLLSTKFNFLSKNLNLGKTE